jgi:uncharacterized protein YjbI with pentapeptide repeats
MALLSIKSLKGNKILFSGQCVSVRDALERMVAQGVDLSNADLRGLNLSNANLDDGSFAGADFSGANLTGANLSESCLHGAIFDYATLCNTCLAYADLSGARFIHTMFAGTDITGVDLSGSHFEGRACFSLSFILAENLTSAKYIHDDIVYDLSKPPIVIHGVQAKPFVIFQDRTVIARLKDDECRHRLGSGLINYD